MRPAISPPAAVALALSLLAAFGCAGALYSEGAPFDPASVQAPACRSDAHDCGFRPLTGPEAELVPPADSTYIRSRGMPGRLDLTPFLPPVGNQGQQNSCLGWALGYGLKSYYERLEHGWEYDSPLQGGRGKHVFSPSFIYNQINGGEDRGATPREAFRLLVRRGASPWVFMPYREDDYSARPDPEARSQALAFRSEDFRRVACSDVDAIKSELHRGHPVMMGIRTHLNFYKLQDEVWENHEGRFFGGHAVLIAGYDDGRKSALGYRGAFRMYNSFGTSWGENGLGWVAYDFLPRTCLGAYVLRESETGESVAYYLNRRGVKVRGGDGEAKISAPVGVRVSRGAFADRVELVWSPVAGAVSYRVERDDGEGFRTAAVVDEPVYRDTAVRERVSYAYRIVTLNEDGYSDPGRPVRGYARRWKKGNPPGPVWNVRGEKARNFAEINWVRAQGAARHEVARWDETRKAWRTLNRNARSRFRDRRPLKNARNYYRVRAVAGRVAGPWSEPVAVQVAGPGTAPGTVRNLSASRGLRKDGIELAWDRVAGARRYRVRRFASEGRTREFFATSNSFVDSSPEVQKGEAFRYYVTAIGAGGSGPPAGPVIGQVIPPARHRSGAIPPPPTGITVRREPANKRIHLSWQAVPGATEYRIYRQRDLKGEFTPIGVVSAPRTSFSAPLFGGPGTLYLYVVKSKTAAGLESEASRPVSGLVRPRTVEPRPVRPFNAGLRRFTGRWSGFTFERGRSYPLELFVAYSGHDFQATLMSEGRRLARFRGDYIARDRVLETRDFRMEIASETGEGTATARVFFRTAGAAPEGKEIVFVADPR